MRGLTIGAIAVAAMAAACGDNWIVDGTGVRSGSRLRARWLVAGDARVFQGFHDRERGEDCAFHLGPGQTFARCLPASTVVAAYVDGNCTIPTFASLATSCELPTRYVHTRYDGCGGGIAQIWRVGALERPTMVYGRDAAGACIALTPREGFVWYAAVEAVPLDRFVIAEARLTEGPERLRERYLHGDDGSRVTIGAHDTMLDVPCAVWDAYGHLACHPAVSEGGWYWADAACTETLVERDENLFPSCAGEMAPYAAIWRFGATCGYERALVRVGEPVRAPDLHYGMGGSCQPEAQEDRELFAIGAEVPASELAAAMRVEVGSGRIRTTMLRGDGASTSESVFYDAQRGVRCSPAFATDGTERCLPDSGGTQEYFPDGRCLVARPYISRWTSCWEAWPDEVTAIEQEPPAVSCGRDTNRVFAAGAELVSGTIFTRDDNGACVPYEWDRTYLRYYEVGAEIPPERFALVDEVIE